MSKVPWVEKYRPRRIADIVGNRRAKERFVDWLRNWGRGKKAALLYGPPGVGKTTLVRVVAEEFGYSLVEMNASDVRTREKIMRIAGSAASEQSLETFLLGRKGTIIFLDEVDGIYARADVGGLRAILNIIDMSYVPVVLAANNPYDPKLREMRGPCEMIRFYRIGTSSIVKFLKGICRQENIRAEEEALRFIAERAYGDVRSAVNNLQAFAEGKQELTLADVEILAYRDRQYDVFETLRTILFSESPFEIERAIRGSEVSFDTLFLTIHENLPYRYQGSENLAKAYDLLSQTDLILGKARRRRAWYLRRYAIEYFARELAQIRERRRYTRFKFPPTRIMLASRLRARKAIIDEVCSLIGRKCHVSRKVARYDFLPFLKIIFEEDSSLASKIFHWLGFKDYIVEYFAES